MIGVANPLTRNTRHGWLAFSASYVSGYLMSVAAIALLLDVLSEIALLVPREYREILWSVALISMAVSDMFGRTICRRRQTPQRLARELPPGWLGLTYGLDIGSQTTTHKVTSLVWAAFISAVLLYPQQIWIMSAVLFAAASLHLFLSRFDIATNILTASLVSITAPRILKFISAAVLILVVYAYLVDLHG